MSGQTGLAPGRNSSEPGDLFGGGGGRLRIQAFPPDFSASPPKAQAQFPILWNFLNSHCRLLLGVFHWKPHSSSAIAATGAA